MLRARDWLLAGHGRLITSTMPFGMGISSIFVEGHNLPLTQCQFPYKGQELPFGGLPAPWTESWARTEIADQSR